jgi:hypothetical protein
LFHTTNSLSMSTPRKLFSLGNIAFQLSLLLFILLSLFLIASANGYLFNSQTRQIEETGIINLTVRPIPVTVQLEDKKKLYNRSEISLSYLKSGRYSVEVSKPGYIPWARTFDITAGQVVVNPFITLFLADGTIKDATADQIEQLKRAETAPNVYNNLDIRGNEIWVKPIFRTYPFAVSADRFELVARLSGAINEAQWFEGRTRVDTHIVFQHKNEIRVIDRDGFNDIKLVTLSNDSPTTFTVDSAKKVLIYRDGEKVLQRELQ